MHFEGTIIICGNLQMMRFALFLTITAMYILDWSEHRFYDFMLNTIDVKALFGLVLNLNNSLLFLIEFGKSELFVRGNAGPIM